MSQPAESPRRFNELAGLSLARLAGISDGVFSVGMTLLVLGLAVPSISAAQSSEADLSSAIFKLAPNLVVYALSFMTLGIFWVGQQTQLEQLERGNRHYTWLQLAFLFAVTLLPFSTQLLAHFPTHQVALVEYWLNVLLLGLMLLAGLEYGLHARLFREDRVHYVAHLMRGRIVIAQGLYAIATAVSLFFPTWVSILLIVLFQLNYVVAPRIPVLDRF
ncbi:MAG TPA: TMEM175 family protein [Candidatus Dormibacteraeota bacterium]